MRTSLLLLPAVVCWLSLPCLARAEAAPETKKELVLDLGGGVKMELILIPAGKFAMGSNGGNAYEKPAHQVTLTKAFYLGKYEVTQAQYRALMGANPSEFKGGTNPVDSVSWDDAQEFCKKATANLSRDRKGAETKPLADARGSEYVVRLPTEAEWEYACRAGSANKFCFGDSDASLGEYAWYRANSDDKSHPVGQKKPNAWGLYDMHGNIWEWCQDLYSGDYYRESPAVDPKGPASGQERVQRGGSWFHDPGVCRTGERLRKERRHAAVLPGPTHAPFPRLKNGAPAPIFWG
ncbi:MAG: formylglycine-generating enzyme family protein [Planctomycetota bacterium]|nr:formylglycine-generating enzyme family protein [Planctomycetota bacterium]